MAQIENILPSSGGIPFHDSLQGLNAGNYQHLTIAEKADIVTKSLNETITGVKTFTQLVTASGFKIPAGTSTQFLKADGSVDNNAYALASTTHNPVTIGTANGLTIVGQQLSLGLSSAATNGALSSIDWNTFNTKASDSNVLHKIGFASETKSGELVIDSGVSEDSGLKLFKLPNSNIITPTTYGTGLSSPRGIAVLPNGDILVCNTSISTISRIPVGGGAAVSYATGLNDPIGIALLSNGDALVVNSGNNTIARVPSGGGVAVPYGTVANAPYGIAVLPNGDALVCSIVNNAPVVRIPSGGGAGVTYGTGVSNSSSITLLPNGDALVYSNNLGSDVVLRIPFGGGVAVSYATVTDVCLGIVVLPNGEALVTGFSDIISKIPSGGGASTTYTTIPGSSPWALATLSNGDILVSDTTANTIIKLPSTIAKPLTTDSTGKVVKTTYLEDKLYAVPSDITNILTQSITNGDTTHAPSGDAVFDALALKQNVLTNPITGLGGLNQIAFYDSPSSITGYTAFLWDNVNKRLGVNGAPTYQLDVFGLLTSGQDNVIRANSSALIVAAAINGTRAGGLSQTSLYFQKNNVNVWALGVDPQATNNNNFFMYDSTANNYPVFITSTGEVRLGTTGASGSGGLNNTQKFTIKNTGTVLVNTVTDNLVDKLQVNGTASGSNATLSNQFLTKGQLDSRTLTINGNTLDLSANREWRVAQADTGVLTFGGLAVNSSTAINVGTTVGVVVDNETNPLVPTYTMVNYTGATGVTVTTVGTGTSSYVMLSAAGVISFQTSFPTSAERKAKIWLGKVSHPAGAVTLVVNEPDYITSPMAYGRDLLQGLGGFINTGVYPSPNGANANINISGAAIIGDGINFVTSRTNPNEIFVGAAVATPFLYRTRTGGITGAVTAVTPGFYDVGGVVTAIPGGGARSSIQYVFAVPGQGFIIQYGQNWYANLSDAIAAVGKETFVKFPNLINNAILIGVIVARKDAAQLNDPTQAVFLNADRLGGLIGASAGLSVGTLQTAYNNSPLPQIGVTDTLGALTVKNSRALDTSSIIEGKNIASTTTFSIAGNGGSYFAGNMLIGDTVDQGFKFQVLGEGLFRTTAGNVGVTMSTPLSSYLTYVNNADDSFRIMSNNAGLDRVTIDSVGRVGIGISIPTNYGAGTKTLSINGTTDSGFLDIYNAGVRKGFVYSISDAFRLDTAAGVDLSFSTTGSEKMRILNNGNVGISNTNPQANLEVGGGGSFANNIVDLTTKSVFLARLANPNLKVSIGLNSGGGASGLPTIQTFDANTNLAVHLNIQPYGGNVGIGVTATNPAEKLQVVGNILASGTITPSDRRLKSNILPLESALDKVLEMKPVSYDKAWELGGEVQSSEFGFIAQELKEIFPNEEVVKTPKEEGDILTVNYISLIAVLTKAIQEQQKQINELNTKLNDRN